MIKFSCVCFWNRDHYIDGQFMVQKSVDFEKTSADKFWIWLYFAHTANPSLRREPYCGCKLPSISFSALCTRVSGYLRKLHTTARAVDRSHRLGAGGVTGCKSYLLHPAKSDHHNHHHVPREKTACKIWATRRASPRALLENLPTIQRGVFATALRGKSGQKRQKQLQQRPKTAPRTTRTSPSMAPNHPRALRDQISQRENGLSHLMRAGRERKKEKEVSERNVQGHCTAQAARRENWPGLRDERQRKENWGGDTEGLEFSATKSSTLSMKIFLEVFLNHLHVKYL